MGQCTLCLLFPQRKVDREGKRGAVREGAGGGVYVSVYVLTVAVKLISVCVRINFIIRERNTHTNTHTQMLQTVGHKAHMALIHTRPRLLLQRDDGSEC